MATLTVNSLSVDGGGQLHTLVAADVAGDEFASNGTTTWLEVANGAGSPITVTFDSKVVSNYGQDDNVAETVTNGTTKKFGPFPAARYTATVDVTYSSVTTITVGVFELPSPVLTI